MAEDPRASGSSWRRRTGGRRAASPDVDPGLGPDPAEGPDGPAGDDLGAVRLDWPAADRDAAAERTDGDGDDGDDGAFDEEGIEAHLLPAVPLLPAIAGRVDAIDGQLRALGLRIDVLSNSIAAVRSAIGDRIDGYAETAAATARHADVTLDEHRRATERAVGEVRRSLTSTEEVLRRLAARIDEVATDVAALVVADGSPAAVRRAPAGDGVGPAVLDAVAALDDRLAAIEDRLAGGGDRDGATAALERSLAEVRSLVEVVVDTMPASAEGSADDVAARVAELVVARLDVDELARQVADRLEQRFEVVVEPGR